MNNTVEKHGVKVQLSEQMSVEGYKKIDGSGVGFVFTNGALVTTVGFTREAIKAISDIHECLYASESEAKG